MRTVGKRRAPKPLVEWIDASPGNLARFAARLDRDRFYVGDASG